MQRYDLCINSRQSWLRFEDLERIIRLQTEMLSECMPAHCGQIDPANLPFSIEMIRELHSTGYQGEAISWSTRGRVPRASGFWSPRKVVALDDRTYRGHSYLNLTVQGISEEAGLVSFIKRGAIEAEADLAIIDGLSEHYRGFAEDSGCGLYGHILTPVTHLLEHWLPDLYWGTVFGPAYVRLFGRDRLMSCPAYGIEELDEEMIYVQLTPSLSDAYSSPLQLDAARLAVKAHLGADAFYNREEGYDWIDHPELAGHRFRTPQFCLLPD